MPMILPQLRIVENAKRKKEPRRLLFSTGSRVFQALDPSIKRYAQTKRLLARRSLGALKRLRDFASAVFFRASDFKVRTSAVVQERRLPFFMIGVSKQLKRSRVSRVTLVRKVNFGLDIDQSVENRPQLCGALDKKSGAGDIKGVYS